MAKPAGDDEPELRQHAARIVEDLLGRKPQALEPLAGGLTNAVFDARVGGERLIIRLNKDAAKLEHYLKEQWAVDHARAADVPAPEILQVGMGPEGSPFMVSRRTGGEEASTRVMDLRLVRRLGALLKRLHSVRTSGFGMTFDWSRNALSRNDTLREYMRNEIKAPERLDALERLKMISPRTRRELDAVLREFERRDEKPTLNHGDARLKNLIVSDKGAIAALIDWECCISMVSPEWDLAIALHDLPIDAKEALAVGYGLSAKKFSDLAPVLRLLNVLHYAPLAEKAAEQKDRDELERIGARLSGAYNLY